jgi:SAM-dependent methyltransferase
LDAALRRAAAPLTIIELGCGTGSISIPLAKRGYRVIGVDVSPEMLAVAREKMRQARTEVTWVEQDMRQLALAPADVVISFCDSLSYLVEEAEVRQTFRRVYEHLRPGGRFLFDVHSPYQILYGFGENTFTLLDREISYIWQCVCDPLRLEVEHQLCFFLRQPDGLYRRLEEVHQQRAYQPAAMVSWLEEAGFADIVVTADFRHQPPQPQSERLFYAARKPR